MSDPIIDTHIGFYGRTDARIDVSKLDGLKGRLIGTVRGYANPPNFDAAGLRTEEVTNDITNLRKLDKGRIDLALVDKALARSLGDRTFATSSAVTNGATTSSGLW